MSSRVPKPRCAVMFDGRVWRAVEVIFSEQVAPHRWLHTTRPLGGGGFGTPEQALRQLRKKVKEHRKPKAEPCDLPSPSTPKEQR